MGQITEDYVSFEVANLLKEKGFDEPTGFVYSESGELMKLSDFGVRYLLNSECDDYPHWQFPIEGVSSIVSAPTIQMAMKWLRKWHNLHCDIGYDFRLGWHIRITSIKEVVQDHDTEMKTYLPNKAVNYPSYEDACEEAIRYCLENLI